MRWTRSCTSLSWLIVTHFDRSLLLTLVSKHRRMLSLDRLTVAEIHVDAAWQTRIETPNRAHDVDALKFVGAVLFKDRRVLHRVFIGSRRSINITWISIPGCRRIWVIVRDLPIPYHN